VWAASVQGATLIEKIESRSIVRVAGSVEVLRMRPRDGMPAIEAVIGDGTGKITAVWLGRRALPGLMLGTRLIIEGRVGGEGAKLQIINPQYEFAAS
jgi:RecG-like helicase